MMHVAFALLSQIYCQGPILDAVQEAALFSDSKYFVDMALKLDPVATLRNFHDLGTKVKDRKVLMEFVEEHFYPPGTELEKCFPNDWKYAPKLVYSIKDYKYREWAIHLNSMWKDLCRQIKPEVEKSPELYSLLYVPNPFVVPGGRFREFYYWDSYWIIKGLLFSEMYTTAKGMIRNFSYMIQQYGFVPNGGRVYYVRRSQPPLLTLMVYEYYLATGDIELINEMLPILEKEYNFWTSKRRTEFHDATASFFQYKVGTKIPRPESWREDMDLVKNFTSKRDKEIVWSHIASAAETGWDFSSRWFATNGTLSNIRTISIVPVDLNAFMCMNTKIMSSLYEVTGNRTKAVLYQARFIQAKAILKQIHWNEEEGVWFDYDLESRQHRKEYYISNALPLFTHCYDDEDKPRKVFNYLQRVGAFKSSKGVPTSFIDSNEQWDSANAWPPLVHMLIEGFRTSGDPELIEFAQKLATQWLKANFDTFERTKNMFEKYNASSSEKSSDAGAGSGGEYEVQTGFGWTNGVVLDLLAKYGEVARSLSHKTQTPSSLSFFLLSIVTTLFLHY